MIHNGRGIVATNETAARSLFEGRHPPGLMYVARRHTRQFGQPAAYECSVEVESGALPNRVEDPEVGSGIGPHTGHPLPTAVVCSRITVDEMAHEMQFPSPPVDQ